MSNWAGDGDDRPCKNGVKSEARAGRDNFPVSSADGTDVTEVWASDVTTPLPQKRTPVTKQPRGSTVQPVTSKGALGATRPPAEIEEHRHFTKIMAKLMQTHSGQAAGEPENTGIPTETREGISEAVETPEETEENNRRNFAMLVAKLKQEHWRQARGEPSMTGIPTDTRVGVYETVGTLRGTEEQQNFALLMAKLAQTNAGDDSVLCTASVPDGDAGKNDDPPAVLTATTSASPVHQ